jgi:hypothetical protein
MSAPTVICVLGMHRSGTSAITRTLNLLGLCLGPAEHLLRPASDNPKGFWEHERLVSINKEILARLGASAMEPPVFGLGWEKAAALEDLRQKARACIHEDFARADLWGGSGKTSCHPCATCSVYGIHRTWRGHSPGGTVTLWKRGFTFGSPTSKPR